MEVTILSVSGCPNTVLLQQRLMKVLGDRRDVRIRHQVITSDADAIRHGMRGSPTLLLDGHDPFAAPDNQESMSCRLYRGDDGTTQGAPTVTQLRALLPPDTR